jgi:hypothetical protein
MRLFFCSFKVFIEVDLRETQQYRKPAFKNNLETPLNLNELLWSKVQKFGILNL